MEKVLSDYIEKKNPNIITKNRHTYLMHNGILGSCIHILRTGVVKTSVILRDGREFNVSYISEPDIVAILCDEEETEAPAPYNIRIETSEATFYEIDRTEFWRDVNANKDMLQYVKNYYRRLLNTQTSHMKSMIMNGKSGALYSMLIRLSEQFGVRQQDGSILINFSVTNDDLASFCGISSDTSVNRMMKDLRDKNVLRIENRQIIINKIDFLHDNVII